MGVSGVVSYLLFNYKLRTTLQEVIDILGTVFSDIFEKPTVKKAFGIIGSQGGEARADKAVVDKIAIDVLNSEKFAGLKMAASAIGLDIDSYIEEHGARATLQALQSLGGLLGIDITSLLQTGDLGSMLGGGGSQPSGSNPYL